MPRPGAYAADRGLLDADESTEDLGAGFRDELAEIRRQLSLLMDGQVETQGAVAKLHAVLEKAGATEEDTEDAVVVSTTKGSGGESLMEEKCTADCRSVSQEDIVCRKSVSSGGMGPRDQSHEHKAALRAVFDVANRETVKATKSRVMRASPSQYIMWRARQMNAEQLEMWFDAAMASIIITNGLFIGLSMDMRAEEEGLGIWMCIDIFFSVVFLAELLLKLYIHGFIGQFCGPQAKSNCFDAFLIMIDLLQLLIVIVFPNAASKMGDAPSASLFRIVRLAKLTRLIRLLRNEVFKDLLSMCQGMIGGMSTLMWSMVLFMIIIYVMALVFREILGRQVKENIYECFDSVPRAMFTTFRCSFGDCSTPGGAPLFEYVAQEYGAMYLIIYCLFVFIVTIGIFNVISAIFVESTMAAAEALEQGRRSSRLGDEIRWSTRITTLIERVMHVSSEHDMVGCMCDQEIDDVFAVQLKGSDVDKVVCDPVARQALLDLDIDAQDHQYLSDILDPDNTGVIPIADFVDGLRRLRGEPRRSDIVSVDLMIRSLQKIIGEMHSQVTEICDRVPPLNPSPKDL